MGGASSMQRQIVDMFAALIRSIVMKKPLGITRCNVKMDFAEMK
jgi:hypothetical protein